MAESCVWAGKGMGIAWANPPYGLLLGVCTCKCLSWLQERHSAHLATVNHMCSLKNIKSFFLIKSLQASRAKKTTLK